MRNSQYKFHYHLYISWINCRKDLPKRFAKEDYKFTTSIQIAPESHFYQYKNQQIWQAC